MSLTEPLELEPSSGLTVTSDRRPPVPEPPPVRLVAVADVHLPAAAGLDGALDAFYVGLFRFDRKYGDEDVRVYHAERFRLMFDLQQPPVDRDHLRPVGIEVVGLPTLAAELVDREIEFTTLKGLITGQPSLLLRDPAGNWVEITDRREMM